MTEQEEREQPERARLLKVWNELQERAKKAARDRPTIGADDEGCFASRSLSQEEVDNHGDRIASIFADNRLAGGIQGLYSIDHLIGRIVELMPEENRGKAREHCQVLAALAMETMAELAMGGLPGQLGNAWRAATAAREGRMKGVRVATGKTAAESDQERLEIIESVRERRKKGKKYTPATNDEGESRNISGQAIRKRLGTDGKALTDPGRR